VLTLIHINQQCVCYGPNSTWIDSTRLDTFDFLEPCDEEAVVHACISLVVFCALSVHVNKTEKTTRCVGLRCTISYIIFTNVDTAKMHGLDTSLSHVFAQTSLRDCA